MFFLSFRLTKMTAAAHGARLFLCFALPCSFGAASADWQRNFEASSTEIAQLSPYASTPSRDIYFSGNTSDQVRLAAKISINGVIAEVTSTPVPYGIALPPSTQQVTQFQHTPYESIPHSLRPCIVQRGLLGLDVRSFDYAVRPGLLPLFPLPPQLDSGSGHTLQAYRSGWDRPHRYGRDCSPQALPEVPGTIVALNNVPDAEATLIAYSTSTDSRSADRIARVDVTALRWDRSLISSGMGLNNLFLVALPGGGYASAGQAVNGGLVTRTAEDGTIQFSKPLPDGVSAEGLRALGSSLLVYASRPSNTYFREYLLLVFASDGSLVGEHSLGSRMLRGALLSTVANESRLALVVASGNHIPVTESLLDISEDGQLTTRFSLPAGVRLLMRLADGSILAGPFADYAIHRIDPANAATLGTIAMPRVGASLAHASTPLADAHGVALMTGFSGEDAVLSHFDHDGNLQWQRQVMATTPDLPGSHSLFVADASRICLVRYGGAPIFASVMDCYARDDGRDLVRARVLSELQGLPAPLQLDPDGSLRFVAAVQRSCAFPCTGQLNFVVAAPDGTQTRVAEVPFWFRTRDDDASGRIALLSSLGPVLTPSYMLAVYSVDGSMRWQGVVTDTEGPLLPQIVDENERVLLHMWPFGSGSVQPQDLTLVQANPGAQLAWRKKYSNWPLCDSEIRAASTGDGDWLVYARLGEPARVTIDLRGSGEDCRTFAMMRVSGSDGSVRWESRQPISPESWEHWVLADTQHGRIARISPGVYATSRDHRVVWHDLSTGRVIGSNPLPEFAYRVSRPVLAPDGALVDFGPVRQGAASQAVLTRIEPRLDEHAGLLDPRQPGLRGSWYFKNTTGQGVLLDYLPEQDLLYGGWFTFRAEGEHDQAGLRWYMLTSRAGERGAKVQLDIESHEKGAFASGRAAESHRVGSATLTLFACDRATLVYRFDEGPNAGRDGAIPLSRAVPASKPCISSNETHRPDPASSASSPPALDARLGGAWFDPEHKSQGFFIDLRPKTTSDAGFFAGAWFTYDPEGAADEPTAQHWFTLAGDLREAHAGMLTVPIQRTLGGSLDAEATSNTWQVGTATLRFTACNRATLEYAFDESDVAHAFAGRNGRLALERIGGCED